MQGFPRSGLLLFAYDISHRQMRSSRTGTSLRRRLFRTQVGALLILSHFVDQFLTFRQTSCLRWSNVCNFFYSTRAAALRRLLFSLYLPLEHNLAFCSGMYLTCNSKAGPCHSRQTLKVYTTLRMLCRTHGRHSGMEVAEPGSRICSATHAIRQVDHQCASCALA